MPVKKSFKMIENCKKIMHALHSDERREEKENCSEQILSTFKIHTLSSMIDDKPKHKIQNKEVASRTHARWEQIRSDL